MATWKKCLLGDLITFQRGHDLSKSNMKEGKFPVVGSNGIIGYHNEYTTSSPSITVGRSGNVGKPFIYYGKSWSHNTTLYVKQFHNSDPVFIYYYLQTLSLGNFAGGSAVPTLNRNHIHSLPVRVPENVEEQHKIGACLKIFDDKIKINIEINNHLEQMAQEIYHNMFIANADPAWPTGYLSDLVTIKYGKDHKKLADGKYPVYGSGGVMRYVERPLYESESVLIPRKGTLNNVTYVNEPFWSVDTMFYTMMNRPHVAKFVYHFVSSIDLESMNAGSAVPSMTTNILNAIELPIPDSVTLLTFDDTVSPFYKAMDHHWRESQKLASIRDALLPHLISGEIDISDLDL